MVIVIAFKIVLLVAPNLILPSAPEPSANTCIPNAFNVAWLAVTQSSAVVNKSVLKVAK